LTDFEWLVLAGGLGSRSENPSLPKILKGGRIKVIKLSFKFLISVHSELRVTFVSRHGLSAARDHLEAVDPVLDWSVHEDAGLGTVAVLVSEASTIESDTIDYSLADTAIRAPLDGFLNQHLCSNQAASVVV